MIALAGLWVSIWIFLPRVTVQNPHFTYDGIHKDFQTSFTAQLTNEGRWDAHVKEVKVAYRFIETGSLKSMSPEIPSTDFSESRVLKQGDQIPIDSGTRLPKNEDCRLANVTGELQGKPCTADAQSFLVYGSYSTSSLWNRFWQRQTFCYTPMLTRPSKENPEWLGVATCTDEMRDAMARFEQSN